jgi:hypothetical protein
MRLPLRLRPEALLRLSGNGCALSIAFLWQVFHSLVSLGAAALGVFFVLRDPAVRPLGLVLLAMLVYFYMTIGLFGFEAYCRCRIPALPLLYLFAGAGLSRLWASRRIAIAAPSGDIPHPLG